MLKLRQICYPLASSDKSTPLEQSFGVSKLDMVKVWSYCKNELFDLYCRDPNKLLPILSLCINSCKISKKSFKTLNGFEHHIRKQLKLKWFKIIHLASLLEKCLMIINKDNQLNKIQTVKTGPCLVKLKQFKVIHLASLLEKYRNAGYKTSLFY